MKYIHLNALFLMFVTLTSCGQSQTDVPEAYIKSEFKDTVTSYGPNTMVRNVKQTKNGDILIAAYNGVFRYDARLNDAVGQGKTFPDFKKKEDQE